MVMTIFLRSLAASMAKLQKLELDGALTLKFDDATETPTIGLTYHWRTVSEMASLTIDDSGTSASMSCIPAYRSSRDYFMTALNNF
jgi:hypothetical protein